MGDGDSWEGEGHRSRRRGDGTDDEHDKDRRKRRYRDDDASDRRSRRRSRSRERAHRRRSRTPGSSDGRSISRDRERRRGRDREFDRDSRSRRRSRERDGGRRRRDYYDDDDNDDEGDLRRGDRGGRKRPSPDGGRGLVKRSGPLPPQDASFALSKGGEAEKPKEKPNYRNTGLLAAASNSVTQADGTTITLKYHEPPEARKPPPRDTWKLFVFKGQDIVDTIDLGTRSCWLIGRELAVVDLPAEHPSISKQHAVIQFRYTEKRNEFGDKIGRVKPYLIDLESANGTMLNGEKVPESRYLELRSKDMIQFGLSTREYVLIKE